MKLFILFSKNLPKHLKPARLAMFINLFSAIYNGWALHIATQVHLVTVFAFILSMFTTILLAFFIIKMTIKEFWNILGGKV